MPFITRRFNEVMVHSAFCTWNGNDWFCRAVWVIFYLDVVISWTYMYSRNYNIQIEIYSNSSAIYIYIYNTPLKQEHMVKIKKKHSNQQKTEKISIPRRLKKAKTMGKKSETLGVDMPCRLVFGKFKRKPPWIIHSSFYNVKLEVHQLCIY